MDHDFGDIHTAYEYVSSGMQFENEALLHRESGQIHYLAEFDDGVFPDEFDSDRYVAIPHKNDLGLGRELVYEFAASVVPEHADDIYDIFRSRGAYRRFKGLLERIGKLQEWYDYEQKATDTALREWCADEKIRLK